MAEIFDPRKVPPHLIALYEAPDEAAVIQKAQEIVKTASYQEQEQMLNDPVFLAIVNQALLGMDEQRADALINISHSFTMKLTAEAYSRFSRLLEDTLR